MCLCVMCYQFFLRHFCSSLTSLTLHSSFLPSFPYTTSFPPPFPYSTSLHPSFLPSFHALHFHPPRTHLGERVFHSRHMEVLGMKHVLVLPQQGLNLSRVFLPRLTQLPVHHLIKALYRPCSYLGMKQRM